MLELLRFPNVSLISLTISQAWICICKPSQAGSLNNHGQKEDCHCCNIDCHCCNIDTVVDVSLFEKKSTNTILPSSELVKILPRTVWKSTARSCEARPAHLEKGWYKSQSGEDRTLEKMWFKDVCHGTYLEIGGLDGIRFSNSYVYNKGLNWTGVLVEASPRNYQQLVVNRPNEIANVHAAVCEKEMDLHWVESRPAVGGFQEFAAPSFQKQWWSKDQIQNAQVVKCRTLEHILLNITNAGPRFYFDFFSLDVEGAELSVLRSVNFDMTSFGVILVEADGHNETKDIEVRVFLESNGYTYLEHKSRSLWFINNNFGVIYEGLIH